MNSSISLLDLFYLNSSIRLLDLFYVFFFSYSFHYKRFFYESSSSIFQYFFLSFFKLFSGILPVIILISSLRIFMQFFWEFLLDFSVIFLLDFSVIFLLELIKLLQMVSLLLFTKLFEISPGLSSGLPSVDPSSILSVDSPYNFFKKKWRHYWISSTSIFRRTPRRNILRYSRFLKNLSWTFSKKAISENIIDITIGGKEQKKIRKHLVEVFQKNLLQRTAELMNFF